MAKQTRKCKICGKEFNIIKNDYVKFRNGFCETKCFIKHKRNKGIVEDIIQLELEELLKITKEEKRIRSEKELEETKKKIKAKSKEINRKENHNKLVNYFMDTYSIRVIPQYFYSKLAQINNGTFKGISKGIPYNHLYEMFKIKQSELDRIANNCKKKGNELVGISRLNYDLAVIVNKYDGYLQWKQKQEILEAEAVKQKQEEREAKVNYKYIEKVSKSRNDDDLNICDLVDDIY